MVDPKNASVLREEACPVVAHRRVPLEAVDIGRAQTKRNTVQLRFRPRDRKCDGCVKENAEIIGVIRTLPEVIRCNAPGLTGLKRQISFWKLQER